MEWSRLSGDSIRLLLAKDEVDELGLTSVYRGRIYRSEVEKLLEMNCNESGFLISGCRALVQLFPKNNGSIEIFITKIDDKKSDIYTECVCDNTNKGSAWEYFIFEDGDALINGCLRIKPIESNLYYAHSGEFVLSVPEHKCPAEMNDILCEYAYQTEDDDIESELVFVCKNAIAKIQQAFNKA